MIVPIVYEPGVHRIVKMEHDAPMAWESESSKYAVSRVGQHVLTVQNHVEVDLGSTDPGQPAVDICVQPRVEVDPRDPDDGRRRQMLRDLLLSRQDTARVRWYLTGSALNQVSPTVSAT